jgi:hypothetical protein
MPAWQSVSSRLTRLASAAGACLILSAASQAATAQQGDDPRYVEAVGRSLSFLESAPKAKTFAIAVVYDPAAPADRATAQNAAERLSHAAGPHRSVIEAETIDLSSLQISYEMPGALYLMPGAASRSPAVRELIKAKKIVTASADPACMQSKTCVLHIGADRTVSITLDMGLAKTAGATFSTVFSMMVTRK